MMIGGKPKFSEEKPVAVHSVDHEFHMDAQKIFQGVCQKNAQ